MEITLENLSFLVDKSETTETLELPRNLNEALKDEIENCWKTRHIVDAMNNKKTSNVDRVHAWKTKYFDMSQLLQLLIKAKINFEMLVIE